MTRTFLSLVTLAWTVFAVAAHSEDAPPPIREFDIPTIERLGREMYEQDQLAWKATDILFTKHSKDELRAQKQHGWIVESFPDHEVVRFIRETDLGPMLAYDVTFTAGQALAYPEPQSALLSGDELAQYNARTTALKNVDRLCAETLNTVALKDPQGDGWLVWAMAATTKPDEMIIGGHYRFAISSDGTSIKTRDSLSRNCQTVSKNPGDLITSQIVSNTPVETLVFASLTYAKVLRVGTPDGQAWKIDGDKIEKIDMDMPGIDGLSARAVAGFAENCELMATDTSHPADKPLWIHIDSVIASTEGNAKFEPKLPSDAKAEAVMCGRDGYFLAPNDYKVLQSGFVLNIVDKGRGHLERMGALEISGGRFRFRGIKGDPMTKEQMSQIGARLDAFQTAIQSAN